MKKKELTEWRAFCEWLDARKRKCAYTSDVPEKWKPLCYVGGNPKGVAARERRTELRLIFYWEGWGWRLRWNWKDRLAELEAKGKTDGRKSDGKRSPG
jgi:hypothetical protein